jgi:hypothetical protein
VTNEDLAYIAGFLDGDSCIMRQLVYRHDYVLGYQIRASVVFYQKQQYRSYLEWLKSKLKAGYIRNRNDGMSEYTIVGLKPVGSLLGWLKPYLRLKQEQGEVCRSVIKKMPGKGRAMTPQLLLELAKEVDQFAKLNYSKRRTNTSQKVEAFLNSKQLLESRRD